jgi:hypothetical protein
MKSPRAVVGLSLLLLAACQGHPATETSAPTAPGVAHPFGAGRLKDFAADDGAWVGKGDYLADVSVLRLAAAGGFQHGMVGVPADAKMMIKAVPKRSDLFWKTTGPHTPNGSQFGLVAYTSEAPGIVNPPLLLKLPAPHAGYISCVSLRKFCLLTMDVGEGQVSMSLPPQALPNWRAIADGLSRAMQKLES